jgi:hypothetical protein
MAPGQGRFLQPDPGNVGAVTGYPQTWHGYGYVANNPLAYVDPSGLTPQDAGGGCTWDPDTNTLNCSTGGSGVGGLPIDCLFYSFLCGGGGGSPGPITTPEPPPQPQTQNPKVANNGSKQTFSQCMTANSSTFSLAGVAQGALNGILGTNFDFKDSFAAQLIGGNAISGIFFGSPQEAGIGAGTATPYIARMGVGTVVTYGRHSERTVLTSLNIAGKGGLPQAFNQASGKLGALLEGADSVLTLGLGFWNRLAIDAAFTAAEAAYCAYITK